MRVRSAEFELDAGISSNLLAEVLKLFLEALFRTNFFSLFAQFLFQFEILPTSMNFEDSRFDLKLACVS